jgi:hypothetical protein
MNASESKFEEYHYYQPLLDAQIVVFSPKEYIGIYKTWFSTLTAVLVFLKNNPELRDIILAELIRHQSDIIYQMMDLIKEKEKHV